MKAEDTLFIHCDGVDDYLSGPLPASFDPSGGEFHILAYVPSTTKAKSLITVGTTSALTVSLSSAGKLQLSGGTNPSPGTPPAGWHVISVRWNSSGRSISIDGGAESSDTLAYTPAGNVYLGVNASLNNPGDFKIKDLVITLPCTSSQRDQIVGWLAWEGGIQSKLPSGHPYRSVRP